MAGQEKDLRSTARIRGDWQLQRPCAWRWSVKRGLWTQVPPVGRKSFVRCTIRCDCLLRRWGSFAPHILTFVVGSARRIIVHAFWRVWDLYLSDLPALPRLANQLALIAMRVDKALAQTTVALASISKMTSQGRAIFDQVQTDLWKRRERCVRKKKRKLLCH